MNKPPLGITPPTPGLEREEPEFAVEDDIPTDDDSPNARSERSGSCEERPLRKTERE